ncbi:DUF2867 domain-containing protein [Vibrio zhugei]|uniref:DUF2867 domain-containing protein n=1 Tax=Vibrio zhugei TaxID=2479546 RepID=A0ABV7C7Q6_9VIBR|nr:DUF2867 domain-containing protein [Vibrio zhugei]
MTHIIVLGASGYIGSQLVPLLLSQGHTVTATARQRETLEKQLTEHPNLTLHALDLADSEAVNALLPHFDTVFFLVHGMSHGDYFVDYELSLADNVSHALQGSHVKHVIYLSALQPKYGSSEHVKARKKTGDILRKSGVAISELRAGIIVGPGSAAFEIMRDFVYNLPILITPKWVDAKANPIALDNLNHYLLALVMEPPSTHQILEVGGPNVLTYREQFKIISRLANKPYRLWSTSLLTPNMASHWLTLITSVPAPIGKALLGGLEHDFIANSMPISIRFPQHLLTYEEAVSAAIKHDGDFIRNKVWGYDPVALYRWQPGFGYYPKQAGATLKTDVSAEALWQVIQHIGSRQHGYFYANVLWRLREWLDVLVGAGKPIRRSPPGPQLQVGDYIDSWKVIRCEPNQFLSLLFGLRAPGLGRLEFTIREDNGQRTLDIRAWWHPKGCRGLLYWFAMMPAHLFIFRGMVKVIERKARALSET